MQEQDVLMPGQGFQPAQKANQRWRQRLTEFNLTSLLKIPQGSTKRIGSSIILLLSLAWAKMDVA